WRMVHAVQGGPQLDLYLTAPEAGLATPTFIAPLGYKSATENRELTLQRQTGESETATLFVNMTFELRETGTGTVVYNSGPLQFNERSRVFFAIVPNAGAPDGKPVQLATLGLDGSGGTVRDPSDPATIRLVNLSNDSPAMDLYRVPSTPLATNVGFGMASPRAATANGLSDFFAVPTGTTS